MTHDAHPDDERIIQAHLENLRNSERLLQSHHPYAYRVWSKHGIKADQSELTATERRALRTLSNLAQRIAELEHNLNCIELGRLAAQQRADNMGAAA